MTDNCNNVDTSCMNFDNIFKRIGDYMFEKLSEDFKVLNLEREKIAKQVNDMMQSGETNKVRQTPTGIIIGQLEVTEKLNALKEELNKINSREYTKNGET